MNDAIQKPQTVEQVLNEMDARTMHQAMALAFAEIEAATKTAENAAFKQGGKASRYADLNAVIDAIKPALIRHGLFFTQHCHPSDGGVTVETFLHHASGESLSMGSLFVPANKRDAHGFGSALTYARRYGLQTAFGVPAEDDDGNAAVRSMPAGTVTQEQFDTLEALREKAGVTAERFCKRFQIDAVALLPADKFAEAKAALENKIREPA